MNKNKTLVVLLFLFYLVVGFVDLEISKEDENDLKTVEFDYKNKTGEFPPFEKIYIINLKKRADKRAAMETRLRNLQVKIEHEFIEAIDGGLIDTEWLEKNDAAPLIDWRDPKIHRPLTRGEIGCMLSHIIAYDKIIESGKPGLIIEDDAIFSDNFLLRVMDLKDDLKENYWDLLYFYRQQLWNRETKVGLNLVEPKYSYLTLAYAVTVEGAKKLRNTPIKQNLIPSDEYLSVMFGQSPLSRYTKLYKDYPKLRALAHIDNDLIFPVETSYEDSDTEKSTSVEELFQIPHLHRISEHENTFFVILSHVKNRKDDGFTFFQRSSNFYGVSPVLVETENQSNDFTIVQSMLNKMQELKGKVKDSNLVVMISMQAERTFFGGNPFSVADDFLGFFRDYKVLFGSQSKSPHQKGNEREDFYPNTVHQYKFLSPNVFVGHYQHIHDFFNSFLNQNPSNRKSFVDFASDYYFYNLRNVQIDISCQIFQTIQQNSEVFNINYKSSQFENPLTFTTPFMVHWSDSGINAALNL